MMRELSRMHSKHLVLIMSDLDDCTTELREKHEMLWASFDILREIENVPYTLLFGKERKNKT